MRGRARAAAVAIAPLVLLASFVYHPYLPGRLPNDAAVAAAVTADPSRWGFAHLAAAVGSGFLIVAFIAIRSFLRQAGEERSSAWALPFVVMGSTLYAILPGMEFAPLAAAETGGDVVEAQAALARWFLPVLLTAALLFGVGVLGFAGGIARSGVLSPASSRVVVVALVVMFVSRFVPLAAVQFYVQGAAGVVALWPLASTMWRLGPEARSESPAASASAGRAESMRAIS